MRKNCGWALALFFILIATVSASAQLTKKYVRQKPQPNFFIPNGALAESQPEKVQMPRYNAGQTTAKHISAKDAMSPPPRVSNRPTINDKQDTPEDSNPISNQENIIEPVATSPSVAPAETNSSGDEVPAYQQMYQQYLKDLESISATGEAASSRQVDEDLSAMNSEERINIDKQFNKSRNVKAEINKALYR